jgi:hypothetical protein
MKLISHVSVLGLSLLMMALSAEVAHATFANPTTVTPGVATAVKATSTAASVGTSIAAPRAPHRLQIQNQCASDAAVQFKGVTAVWGQAYVVPAGQTITWNGNEGPVPVGPYSLITQSATCSPDTNTGLTILEMP